MSDNILSGLNIDAHVTIDGEEVNASDIRYDGNTITAGSKTFNCTGKTITIVVQGDCGTVKNVNNVRIEGDVEGDVTSSAGDIEIHGDVEGNVKAMAGNIEIGGDVEGNVSTMCGNIRHG